MKNKHLFTTQSNGQVRMQLSGDLSAYRVMAFKQQVLRCVAETEDDILIDIRKVRSLDLSCINLLVSASRKLKRENRNLRIVSGQLPQLQRWLHLTKFDRVLDVAYEV